MIYVPVSDMQKNEKNIQKKIVNSKTLSTFVE